MEVRDAVARAKAHLAQVFADEPIAGIELEEVVRDDSGRSWDVTLGLVRPRQADPAARNYLAELLAASRRSLKVVKVAEPDGRLISITNRAG